MWFLQVQTSTRILPFRHLGHKCPLDVETDFLQPAPQLPLWARHRSSYTNHLVKTKHRLCVVYSTSTQYICEGQLFNSPYMGIYRFKILCILVMYPGRCCMILETKVLYSLFEMDKRLLYLHTDNIFLLKTVVHSEIK